jgi:GTP-binding protein
MSDPSYPGQWRISGHYIEQIAKMTHWEYPEAVSRFGRQLDALGIADGLQARGAQEGDLVMVDDFDFEFNPSRTMSYIPQELLDRDEEYLGNKKAKAENQEEEQASPWRPFQQGGFLDVDRDELVGFGEADDWDLLDEDEGEDDWEDGDEFVFDADDEVWTSS